MNDEGGKIDKGEDGFSAANDVTGVGAAGETKTEGGGKNDDAVVAECRDRLLEAMKAINSGDDDGAAAAGGARRNRALILSGGVDTSAIMSASELLSMEYAVVVTVIVVVPLKDGNDGHGDPKSGESSGRNIIRRVRDDDDDSGVIRLRRRGSNGDNRIRVKKSMLPPDAMYSIAVAEGAGYCGGRVDLMEQLDIIPDGGDDEGDADTDESGQRDDNSSSNKHHVMLCFTVQEMIEKYLPMCVDRLATFDGMTLRNSLVIMAAMDYLSSLGGERRGGIGITDVVVGDGADELFGGYSFMWGGEDGDPDEWVRKRNELCSRWTFATQEIADGCGDGRIRVRSPYTEPDFVSWATERTDRSHCISDDHEIQLRYGQKRRRHRTGKVCLRRAFDTPSSWRRKDPIEVGSGITVMGTDDYWDDFLTNERYEAEKRRCADEYNVVVRDKEHLVNFLEYERIYDLSQPPSSSSNSNSKGEDDDKNNKKPHPTKKRLGVGLGCVGCCYELDDDGGDFCHICGAYPARRT